MRSSKRTKFLRYAGAHHENFRKSDGSEFCILNVVSRTEVVGQRHAAANPNAKEPAGTREAGRDSPKAYGVLRTKAVAAEARVAVSFLSHLFCSLQRQRAEPRPDTEGRESKWIVSLQRKPGVCRKRVQESPISLAFIPGLREVAVSHQPMVFEMPGARQ